MANEKVMSKTELLTKLQDGWRDFSAYLKTLTEAQMTTPRDAVGWTIKDHLVHIAIWEDGISSLLNGQSRNDAMGIDEATANSEGFDTINEVGRQQHKDKPLAEVLSWLQAAHERMMAQVQLLTDEDLKRPYRHWDKDSTQESPILGSIIGNSYEHYVEHQAWMDAIAKTPF